MSKLNQSDLFRNLAKRAPAEKYENGFRFNMVHVVGDFIIVPNEMDEFSARLELLDQLKIMFGAQESDCYTPKHLR